MMKNTENISSKEAKEIVKLKRKLRISIIEKKKKLKEYGFNIGEKKVGNMIRLTFSHIDRWTVITYDNTDVKGLKKAEKKLTENIFDYEFFIKIQGGQNNE